MLLGRGDARGARRLPLADGARRAGRRPCPAPDFAPRPGAVRALHRAIAGGLVRPPRPLRGRARRRGGRDGLRRRVGLELELDRVPRPAAGSPGAAAPRSRRGLLFSESCTRFLVEVRPGDLDRLFEMLAGLPAAEVGRTVSYRILRMLGLSGKPVRRPPPSRTLLRAWKEPHPRSGGRPGLPRVISSGPRARTATGRPPTPSERRAPRPSGSMWARSSMAGAAWTSSRALAIPGGFCYGDDLGAGTVLANQLATKLADALRGVRGQAAARSWASATGSRCWCGWASCPDRSPAPPRGPGRRNGQP